MFLDYLHSVCVVGNDGEYREAEVLSSPGPASGPNPSASRHLEGYVRRLRESISIAIVRVRVALYACVRYITTHVHVSLSGGSTTWRTAIMALPVPAYKAMRSMRSKRPKPNLQAWASSRRI